ncbi:hypothetical protein SUNI508_03379 [Seiridium unicorne]|uniref:Uncharacterized protein n=1 Tax=Seiridium unicorne TaxID=138068 RepID=A0ABR2VC89_9PEZI
MAFFDVRPTNY